jgi:hypothetical protein
MLSATENARLQTERDRKVLLRYLQPRGVADEDYEILLEYAGIGMVCLKPSFSRREARAWLTECGKNLLGIQ